VGHRFRAMGTDVEVLLDADDPRAAADAAAAVRACVVRLEQVFSRFLPDSALSRLNRAGGGRADPELVELVARAVAARDETGGRFDPTVHDAVLAAGYDRTFEDVARRPGPARPPVACGGAVEVDRALGVVRLGRGVRLDLGGIAKGYAVDRAIAAVDGAGACLVNAGGDLAVTGAPAGGTWPVAVDTPEGGRTVGLAWGALATSGRDRRRWDGGRHHVIDPATGAPSRTDLLRVTVAAESAERAEVLATALLVAGADAARREAEERGLSVLLVPEVGPTIATGGLA
ncbi:MAG: FAD:protein FMN transferase, partial [Actinomycetota bacterium]